MLFCTNKWLKSITLKIRRYVGNCFSVFTVTAHLFGHKCNKDLNTEYLKENLRILEEIEILFSLILLLAKRPKTFLIGCFMSFRKELMQPE